MKISFFEILLKRRLKAEMKKFCRCGHHELFHQEGPCDYWACTCRCFIKRPDV